MMIRSLRLEEMKIVACRTDNYNSTAAAEVLTVILFDDSYLHHGGKHKTFQTASHIHAIHM